MSPVTPHTALRCLLVDPKGKVEPEEQDELVYQIPGCGAAYIGETGRLFKTKLREHKKDVEDIHMTELHGRNLDVNS